MLSLMKRKRYEVSCYNALRSTFERLDVLPDFLVEGKILELHLTSTDEEGNLLEIYLAQREEEGRTVMAFPCFAVAHCDFWCCLFQPKSLWMLKISPIGQNLYLSLSALIMKDFGNRIVFGFYHFPRDWSASYSVYDMLQRVGPLCGSDCQRGGVLLLARCGITFSGCTGLCRSLMREGYQRQLHNARNTTESMWPSIPAFLLWTIKDMLDIVDDMRLSAVCRDWWLASASYPRKQSLGNGAPCLMQTSKKARRYAQTSKKTRRNAQTCKIARSNAQDFLCVATKKKYTLELPEFRRSFILYSKEGWFLMKQKNSKSAKELGVFLINPITGGDKIKLPSIDPSTYMGFGSFSTREGYPHCVVLLVGNSKGPITIKTAYPGDEMWTNHTYTGSRFQRREFCQLITIREHVYCYNRVGEMLVYNMDTQVWKEAPALPWNPEEYTYRYMTEFEGHVIEVHQQENSCEFGFFKYNDTKTAWEKLNSDDVKDASWFFADCFEYAGRFSFCKRGKGLKVYHVCSKFDEDDILRGLREQHIRPSRRLIEQQRFHVDRSGFHVVCYDLMNGSREILSLPYRVSCAAIWVDN